MEEKIRLPHLPSFPKIFHIGEDYITELFNGKVEITEKIDGSQWNFGKDENGELVFRSKGQDLTYRPVPKMFELAHQVVLRQQMKIPKDTYFFCEFLNSPHHNVLEYERVPQNNLYLFGVMEGKRYVKDYHKLHEYADLLDVEKPNILFFGEINNLDDLKELLNKPSILGKEQVEGIVVKNYHQRVILTANLILPMAMGKYVREDFKEKHASSWKSTHSQKGKLESFVNSFRTEARWQKAVQHLRDNGELENAPRDIGKLMVEIGRDLLEEESEHIKDGFFKIFKDEIIRKARGGFPEWYKNQLLERGITSNEKIN